MNDHEIADQLERVAEAARNCNSEGLRLGRLMLAARNSAALFSFADNMARNIKAAQQELEAPARPSASFVQLQLMAQSLQNAANWADEYQKLRAKEPKP